jgi:plasmid stabilization system protein ParE
MRRIEYRPEAREDIREAYQWYEAKRTGLGEEFLLCVEASLERICRSPKLFEVQEQEVRRALIHRFPYGIYYEMREKNLLVYGILHLKRAPSNWKDRKDQGKKDE